MKKRFSGIKRELTVTICALVLIIIILLSSFVIESQKRALINEIEAKGMEIANMIASNTADYLLIGYEIETAKILKDVVKNKDIKYAFVVDKKGIIIAHNDMTFVGKKYELPQSKISFTIHKNIIYEDKNKEKIIDFKREVISRGKVHIGDIHIGLSYNAIQKPLKQAYIKIILITLLFIFVSIIASVIIANRITVPVEILARGARAVGEGDLNLKIELKSNNELGMLADTFNSMIVNLKKAQEIALEKRALEKEIEIAREIQLSLIPQKIPELKGYEIAAYYQAARMVGGDYYDIIAIDENKFGFVMADVSGNGIPSALVMAMASAVLREQAVKIQDPKECLIEFNNEIFNRIKKGMFLTVFYGILDIVNNTFEFASAGHDALLIFKKNLQKVNSITTKGFPVGMGDSSDILKERLTKEKIFIDSGDKIAIYTDGVFEAINENKEQMGLSKFIETIEKNGNKSCFEIKEIINSTILDFTKGVEQFDDIAFLIIEKN